MKEILFNLRKPRLKCIPLLNALNLLAAPAQAVGGVVSSIINANAVKSANKQNVEMQRETNDLQYQMMQEQNAWNRQQAIDMFNLEASYNSPLSQMQRLKDAGLNPAVAFGQNLTTTSGNSNASTPAAVGVPTPQAPRVSPVPSPVAGVFDQISQNVLNVSQALAAASQAKKTTAETKRIYSLLDQELKNMQTAGQNEQIRGNILKIQEDLEQLNYEVKSQTQFKKEYATIEKLAAETALVIAQGKTEEAEQRLKDFQARTQEKEYRLLIAKVPLILQNMREGINLLKQQQATERAQQASLYAGAERTQVETSIMRESKIDILRIRAAEADKNENEAEELRRTLDARVQSAIENSGMSHAQKKYWYEQYSIASKRRDYYELEMVLSAIPFSSVGR